MSVAPPPWKDRIADIDERVRLAHKALAAGDATGAAWRARATTEALLLLLAELHEVAVPRGPSSPATLEALRKALRHAKVLERKVEDHVDYVQRVGNRAAHAQAHPGDAVELGEARNVLAALDQVHRAVVARVPAPSPNPRSRPTRRASGGLVLAAAAVLAVAAPFVGFQGTTALLAWLEPPPPAEAAASAPPATLVDAALLERLLADEGDAATEADDDATVVLRDVGDGLPADDARLARLACEPLLRAHDAVWSRHGLRFSHPASRAAFPDPRGLATRDVAEATLQLTPTDRTNAARVRALLVARGCACPTEEGPCRP